MNSVWEKANSRDSFASRHIGPDEAKTSQMLMALGYNSLEALLDAVVPEAIRFRGDLDLPAPASEHAALEELRLVMSNNTLSRSYIGMGYYDTLVPPVIQRNVLENPGWYTQYTPYQAEIAQGRLEALLNFQTVISDLTALPVANASLLDEGTAAAEAMALCSSSAPNSSSKLFFVAADCHPQTIEVVRTRARALGIELLVDEAAKFDFGKKPFGVLIQYPGTYGEVVDYSGLVRQAHEAGAMVVAATDLLALCLLKAPGEIGADIAVGSAQRFGVPLGYGGPHAAFFATKEEYVRKVPGRIVGVSKDASGRKALRLALQTREQHIRRDRATSNICTSQVLLAICASMYAVYHGPDGLKSIAERVHHQAAILASGLRQLGRNLGKGPFFDTLRVHLTQAEIQTVRRAAEKQGMNLRILDDGVGISLDEATTAQDLRDLLQVFNFGAVKLPDLVSLRGEVGFAALQRNSQFLSHPVFNSYHSETEMMRYIRSLESRDLSLTHSMIPLGSCTMKLNAAAELMPITWPHVNRMHPFAPLEQTRGYQTLFSQLEAWLCSITGFDAFSLQPNSGSQGEYAGLLVIKQYHESRGQSERDVCLIPSSAHGTNPASAVMANFRVVVVKCDADGNVDIADLKAKAAENRDVLGALMITYPSTHGVFEEGIREICQLVHDNGGQVYMDGANLNAQVGLTKAGHFGPDVCHLNLHKTFCIPHGGGGPGMGPIGVRKHLADFLPNHPIVATGGTRGVGPVAAAPWGSASILPISWMYIRMMGANGLAHASSLAILNANYIAKRLDPFFPVVFKGSKGLVAHECIVDLSGLRKTAGIEVEDVAKRLIDYGFHAPTVSWPVPGSLMIEPTESETMSELDRFCDALIAIREEIRQIELGAVPREGNILKRSPHTALDVCTESWDRPYGREQAAFPLPYLRDRKFWPHVSRIDSAYGDRNLVCSCPAVESYS